MDGIASTLLSCLRLDKLLRMGWVECELTDGFSNPVIFQCGLEKKSRHINSGKHKEAFWLTNLVSLRFSSCRESWKITPEKRLWVTDRTNYFTCIGDLAHSAGYQDSGETLDK